MQSIFRYPGGKTRKSIQDRILKVAPEGYTEYREPFVGGGGIFFAVPPEKKRWINDFDKHLIQVYRALKERPAEFISRCREIAPQEKEEILPPPVYNRRLKDKFSEFAENEGCDQALRYFFVNRTVWAGRVNYEIKSRMYFSVPAGWNIVKTDKLEKAAEVLRGVRITSTSYQKLLLDPCPQGNAWVYCDPPYNKNTELDRNSQLYRHGFTKEDHIELSEVVKNSPHKVCLSYDDDPFIRSLYADFRVLETEWTYCGTSSAKCDASSNNKKKAGKELLILNY